MQLSPNEIVEVKSAIETGNDLSDALYTRLFDHYINNGEMPYGVAKARTGDPVSWIHDQLADLLASQP